MRCLLISPRAKTGGLESLRSGNQILQGVLYIAAAVRKAGHFAIVTIADATDIETHIRKYKPDVLGVSCVTATYPIARDLIIRAKQLFPDLKTIIGGHHATFMYKEVIEETGVDYVCRGEGEEIFCALLNAMEQDKTNPLHSPVSSPAMGIEGIVYKHGNKFYNDNQIAILDNLDDLPRITLDLVAEGLSFSPKIVSSRGCPYKCSFCSISAFYNGKYRQRKVMDVISDIEEYVSWGATSFWFHDDNLTVDTAWVEDFCRTLIKKRIRISWNCMSRVDTICKYPDLIRLMAAAGCKLLAIGIESGIPEVLKRMHKKIDDSQIRQAIKILNSIKISHNWYMIIGSGDEFDQPRYIEQNIEFFASRPFGYVLISVLTPFPGTELYNNLASENRLLHQKWEQYDATHCVYQPLGMSPKQLENYLPIAYRKVYFRKGLRLIPLLYNSFRSHAIRPSMIWNGLIAIFRNYVLGQSLDRVLQKK